jgi:hypothetical protein
MIDSLHERYIGKWPHSEVYLLCTTHWRLERKGPVLLCLLGRALWVWESDPVSETLSVYAFKLGQWAVSDIIFIYWIANDVYFGGCLRTGC